MTQNDVFKKYHEGTLPKNRLFFDLFLTDGQLCLTVLIPQLSLLGLEA
jgi:hypothetical protein